MYGSDGQDFYKGTTILKNIPGIRDQRDLDQYEAAITLQRADEPLPEGSLGTRHYRAVHRHLFGDVYRWAGSYRRVRISKGETAFCYPEHINDQMRALFLDLVRKNHLRDLGPDRFAAEAAHFLATLNAIHPFREGNGRTQTMFLALLADQAGYRLRFERLKPKSFLAAMIQSFYGDEQTLARHLLRLLQRNRT
jgi:cell filamentation protein